MPSRLALKVHARNWRTAAEVAALSGCSKRTALRALAARFKRGEVARRKVADGGAKHCWRYVYRGQA